MKGRSRRISTFKSVFREIERITSTMKKKGIFHFPRTENAQRQFTETVSTQKPEGNIVADIIKDLE